MGGQQAGRKSRGESRAGTGKVGGQEGRGKEEGQSGGGGGGVGGRRQGAKKNTNKQQKQAGKTKET